MVQGVDHPDRGHRAAGYGQYVDAQVVEAHPLSGVDDVDRLDLGVDFEHGGEAHGIGATRPEGVPVLLLVFLVFVGAIVHVDGDYFQVVVEVGSFVPALEVLDMGTACKIAFQLFDIVLYNLRGVSDGQLKGLESLAELKFFQEVGGSDVLSFGVV